MSSANEGTVYSGPAIDATYRGAAAAGTQSHAPNETVFDPSTHVTSRPEIGASVRQAVTKKVQSASIRFFTVSGLAVLEYMAYRDTRHDIAVAALVTAVVFSVIGSFAMRASRAAFIAGMLLYGASTALLLLNGCLVCMTAVAIPLIVHLAILNRLWSGYQSVGELKMIEAL
jgi:hypothetical protein